MIKGIKKGADCTDHKTAFIYFKYRIRYSFVLRAYRHQ